MQADVDWIEIYRSNAAHDCDERLLLLESLGIRAVALADARAFALWVGPDDAHRAHVELARYALENRAAPPPPRVQLHRSAWLGSLAYLLATFVPSALAAQSAFGLDWLASGALDGTRVRAGEVWRAVTALTLHADLAHFASNAGFGAVFGALAARVYGPGRAWLAILVAATCANLLEAAGLPAARTSIGASTAVFAALGLLCIFRWPDLRRTARTGVRGASIVAALVLLALLGTGDARTDVAAHALGFVAGMATGLAWQAAPRLAQVGDRTAGALALAVLGTAWLAALAA